MNLGGGRGERKEQKETSDVECWHNGHIKSERGIPFLRNVGLLLVVIFFFLPNFKDESGILLKERKEALFLQRTVVFPAARGRKRASFPARLLTCSLRSRCWPARTPTVVRDGGERRFSKGNAESCKPSKTK